MYNKYEQFYSVNDVAKLESLFVFVAKLDKLRKVVTTPEPTPGPSEYKYL